MLSFTGVSTNDALLATSGACCEVTRVLLLLPRRFLLLTEAFIAGDMAALGGNFGGRTLAVVVDTCFLLLS